MSDYGAAAIAPAFWKLRAFPEHPAVIERVAPDAAEVARYDVQQEAEVVPSLESIGRGLFKVTSHYKVASGEIRATQRYYISAGRFSLVSLSDGLGAAIEGALNGAEAPAPPEGAPSLPWTWQGGYPQRITCPDASLIAEVYENPDSPSVIAPLICEAVNARFGWAGHETYKDRPSDA